MLHNKCVKHKKRRVFMSRTENVKKNLIFNMIKFASQLVLQFVLRTALIYFMGAEYLGLNGLFTNIFSFLNLAELGIGGAIVFSMYKPIAEGDTEKVKTLQNVYKKFYIIVAIIVASLGLIILPFLNFLINGEVSVDINIYILYVLYLINTIIGYFSAHKKSLLFAYQRNDIENKVKTFCLFGMTLIQILILFLTKNYYLYFSITIIFTLLECILVHVWANKLFPQLNGKAKKLDKTTKKQLTKNIAAISMHKVGAVVVFSTDNILISAILGLTILGAYSNYFLITSMVSSIFYLLSDALKGSVGNLIASKDKEYVHEKYKQINFIFSVLSSFATICLICLFQPFVDLWTGGGVYLLDFSTVLLLCISFYLHKMRIGTQIFKDTAGIFWQDRFSPIFESVINLSASIILGIFLGLNGIILGTIISTVFAPLWVEPKVLHKYYFQKRVKGYFLRYLRDFIVLLACGTICYFICALIPTGGLLLLIARFAVVVILSVLLLTICYLPTKDFKSTFGWLKEVLKSLKK